jgi:hypothetical protein
MERKKYNDDAVKAAITALADSDEQAVYTFMGIAEALTEDGKDRLAREIRDRVAKQVPEAKIADSSVQEVMAILNDAAGEARKHKKPSKKSVKKHADKPTVKEEPKPLSEAARRREQILKAQKEPGAHTIEVRSGALRPEQVVIRYDKNKHGEEMIRILASSTAAFTPGTAYLRRNIPDSLKKAVRDLDAELRRKDEEVEPVAAE